MRKKYEKPSFEVVVLKQQTALLNGSPGDPQVKDYETVYENPE